MSQPVANPNIRTGKHEKGRRTSALILEQATQVLMRDGYSQLSLRRVAQAAGVTLGNLQYYFPTKPDLVEAMLVHVVTGYVETFDRLMAEVEGRPEDQLTAVLTYVIRDLTSPRTTVLFPELWSMANHEPAVQQYVEDLYETYRRIVASLIAKNQSAPVARTGAPADHLHHSVHRRTHAVHRSRQALGTPDARHRDKSPSKPSSS